MRYFTAILSAAAALTAGLRISAAEPTPSQQVQSVKEFTFHKVQDASLKYLLFLPKGYEPKAEKRWP